jgi:hypothetical protein
MEYTTLQDWPEAASEDRYQQVQRRYRQRRCLVCGARRTRNRQTSFFCDRHYDDWRYCSTCRVLRTTDEHGKDSRCRGCANVKATAQYHADPDRCLYRLRLKALARRQQTRADMLLVAVRRQIALAALVRATPGWSWERRGRAVGYNATYLAESYRKQLRIFTTTTELKPCTNE